MAFNYGEGTDRPYSVSENLSAKQYFCMKAGATLGTALLGDTAGGVVLGILMEDGLDASSQTKNASIRTEGEALGVAGAAFSKDDPLQDNGSGQLITATTGDYVFARANEAATAANQVVQIRITHEGTF